MKILCLGSLNIDHVYSVDHFVKPGETIPCRQYQKYCGGKGLNQSIALAKAGIAVYHAGRIGRDGLFLKEYLESKLVDTQYIEIVDTPTGHAIIQINKEGENAILIFGGANHTFTTEALERILNNFNSTDWLLIQNEVNGLQDIIRIAADRSIKILFNPAPLDKKILSLPLDKVSCFILNEVEGQEISGEENPEQILKQMSKWYPQALTILTLGARGVMASSKTQTLMLPAYKVKVVDTTAAGDAFIGYFIAAYAQCKPLTDCLQLASQAAALTVTKCGAAESIPIYEEVMRAGPTLSF
jgi:ribokinase